MYTDLLIRIKNAQAVNKETVKVPYSAMDRAVLNVLKKGGFIDDFTAIGRVPKKILEVNLKYKEDGKGIVSGVKVLSKPSRHLYSSYNEIYPIRQGYGLLVVSTSKGIMDGRSARKIKLGGELLFEIW
ncbi:30S ribosomal protein S8 [Patescibacteria group bacterium]|nr:30S ribosomal protein S8 [Patescibacteria group bacterium]